MNSPQPSLRPLFPTQLRSIGSLGSLGSLRSPGSGPDLKGLGSFNCTFKYISSCVFIIGIMVYIFEMIRDSYDHEGDRPMYETVWIWGMLVLLIFGFFASSFC